MPLDAALERKIHDSVIGGLPEERERRDDAVRNLRFFTGNFKEYKPKRANIAYDEIRPRYSLLMQRIIKTLCANLYKAGPKRSIAENEEASAWLEWIYRSNAMNAMWQRADLSATWGDWCAFQVRPISNPLKPIDILLWDASQLYVWTDPEDQRIPVAVATRDAYNEQTRLRIWTDETITTYMTRELQKGRAGQTSGGAAFEFRNKTGNPLGILPFSFVHFDMPLQDFDTSGPGDFLACANDNANHLLTNIGGAITYNLWPVVVTKNTPIGWRPPAPIKPGDVWNLQANPDSEGQDGDPSAEYLQADSSFVASGWDDLEAYFNHTLEMTGVPKSAVRMEQESARSGVAIIAEQIPLILWAQSRQEPFGHYERSLAQLVLKIGGDHLGTQEVDEYRVKSSQLIDAAYDTQLTLRWPKMYPRIPGQEQDVADQWELDTRQTSPTLLMMDRNGYTREEAEAREQEIAADWKRWHTLFGEVDLEEAKVDAEKLKMMGAAQAENEPDGDEPKGKPDDDSDGD